MKNNIFLLFIKQFRRFFNFLYREVKKYILYYHYSKILSRVDSSEIPRRLSEIKLFVVVKNEFLRLPYFFKYYSKLGVDRFFVIDNGSTDKTIDFLLSQKNTHIFKTEESFAKGKFGSEWVKVLMSRYAKKSWCITVDADEFFIYPDYERRSLKDLCKFLDNERVNALNARLLDMYSNKSIHSTEYRQGENVFNSCRYFDREPYYSKERVKIANGEICYTSAMRKRIFDIYVSINKVPLFKFKSNLEISPGWHYLRGETCSKIEGTVMHFKFLFDFIKRASYEAKIEEHYCNAKEYKVYNESFSKNNDINLWHSDSAEFKDSQQLVDMDIMKTTDLWKESLLDKKPKQEAKSNKSIIEIFKKIVKNILFLFNKAKFKKKYYFLICEVKEKFNLIRRSGAHYYSSKMIREPFWINVNGKLNQIHSVGFPDDVNIYREVVIEDVYGIFKYSKNNKPKLIVDIGAYIGMFSKLCSSLFCDARIVAYEPNQKVFKQLSINSEVTNIEAFPYAVAEKSGSFKFDVSETEGKTGLNENGAITVKCIASYEVEKGNIIDLLKMDCEGAEWQILKDKNFLSRVKAFRMEYHLIDGHTVDELKQLIKGAGHKILSIKKSPPLWGKYDNNIGMLWSENLSFKK